MSIDMMDLRHHLVAGVIRVGDKANAIVHSDNFVGELGGALLALGVVLATGHLIKGWIKRKGYRMVVRDRNDKIHALLLDILQDGLDKAVEDGKLSHQEEEKTFTMLSHKLGFRDLVPKKRIARQVKAEIKARRATSSKVHPKIPGDPPTPIKAVAVVGKKFFKRA